MRKKIYKKNLDSSRDSIYTPNSDIELSLRPTRRNSVLLPVLLRNGVG